MHNTTQSNQPKTNTNKKSVADIIAERFIASLKNGVAPWQKPWAVVRPQNAVSKRAYTGVNAFIIGFFGTDDYYLTFNQIKALGGRLEEGTESLPIQFYTKLDPKKIKNFKPRAGSLANDSKPFFMARFYKVFPLNKCNLPDFKRATFTLDFKPIEQAEKLAGRCLTPITFGGSSAFFKPSAKTINLPDKSRFKSEGHYYSTLFHEIGHSLMSEEQRSKGSNAFGDELYSKEELVAELFASLCLNYCNLLSADIFDNSTSYLQAWLKRLTDEPKLIATASTEAFRRFNALLGEASPEGSSDSEPEGSPEAEAEGEA